MLLSAIIFNTKHEVSMRCRGAAWRWACTMYSLTEGYNDRDKLHLHDILTGDDLVGPQCPDLTVLRKVKVDHSGPHGPNDRGHYDKNIRSRDGNTAKTTNYGERPIMQLHVPISVTNALYHRDGGHCLVMLPKVPFVALSEVNMLPYGGHVTLGYMPSSRTLQLAGACRIVDFFSRKLQSADNLASDLAEVFETVLGTNSLALHLVVTHSSDCLPEVGSRTVGLAAVDSSIVMSNMIMPPSSGGGNGSGGAVGHQQTVILECRGKLRYCMSTKTEFLNMLNLYR